MAVVLLHLLGEDHDMPFSMNELKHMRHTHMYISTYICIYLTILETYISCIECCGILLFFSENSGTSIISANTDQNSVRIQSIQAPN